MLEELAHVVPYHLKQLKTTTLTYRDENQNNHVLLCRAKVADDGIFYMIMFFYDSCITMEKQTYDMKILEMGILR